MLSDGRTPSAAKSIRKFFSRLSSRKARNGSVESTYRTNYTGDHASNWTERAPQYSPEEFSYGQSAKLPKMVKSGSLSSHLDASPLALGQI